MVLIITPGHCDVSIADHEAAKKTFGKGKMLTLHMIDPLDNRHVEVYLSDDNLKELTMQLIDYLIWDKD